MDSWTESWPSIISDPAATRDNIWRRPQTQGYTDEKLNRLWIWYDPRLLAEEANITSQKASMSDGETSNWRRSPKLVNRRQDCHCDERPTTRSSLQQLSTNHMSEHHLEVSIWHTGRQNWRSHKWIHASDLDRHWRWKQRIEAPIADRPINGQGCPK